MRKIVTTAAFILFLLQGWVFGQGTSINTTGAPADPSAMIDVTSTDKGALIPRMTDAQRNAIVNPAEGLLIFNTISKCFNVYKSGAWFEICGNCLTPPSPVAGSNSPVCVGDTIKLTASPVQNATYAWVGPNGFTSSLQNPKIPNAVTANAGIYSLTASVSGCTSLVATVNVGVNAVPVSSFTCSPNPAQVNQNATFTPATSGATYSWVFPNGTPGTSTAQNPVVLWATTGSYNVSLTVTQNGCSSSTTNSISVSNCGSVHGTQTFNYTGAVQTFTVPACVTLVTLEVWGGRGGNSIQNGSAPNWDHFGGYGGYAKGDLVVTPGQVLNVYVGGQGGDAPSDVYITPICVRAGWNGGGCATENRDGAGGGATDVRIGAYTLSDRVIVGGAGGGADQSQGNGGAGGYPNGSNGAGDPTGYGYGGTQTAGGQQGTYQGGATPGTFGVGGNGGTTYAPGGGGGWYGGGGGTDLGGGGGGSSYIGGVTNSSTQNGIWTGDGKAVITW